MLPVWEILLSISPDRTITGWLLIANSLIALACIVHEIMRSRTSQGSIGWLLSLVLLPFPTTLIYMVFGLKIFDDYAALQTESGRALRISRAKELSLYDREASAEWPVQTRVSSLPFLRGNEAELLIDGNATFDSILAGIARAKSSIIAQFYIIRDDQIGNAFADALIERARAGVHVRLLYDDVGSFFLPRRYKRRLKEAGVVVASFNQRHRWLQIYGPTRINWRNHRKLVVVDGREAWAGGLNVGDEYLGRSARFGHWRDTHVRISGPAALACAVSFAEDWHWATGEKLPPDVPDQIASPGDQAVLVMPTGPADALEDCSIAFSDAISSATKRLWIVSPYFVPDLDVQTAIFAAALRGVEVRIMLPEKPDHRLVWLASRSYTRHMVKHGVGIYRYSGGFLHQKVILVDDRLAGVGTVNLDNRSFRINFEMTLWFNHERMLDDVEKMLIADFAQCSRYTMEERAKESWWSRFMGQAARLLSPIL